MRANEGLVDRTKAGAGPFSRLCWWELFRYRLTECWDATTWPTQNFEISCCRLSTTRMRCGIMGRREQRFWGRKDFDPLLSLVELRLIQLIRRTLRFCRPCIRSCIHHTPQAGRTTLYTGRTNLTAPTNYLGNKNAHVQTLH